MNRLLFLVLAAVIGLAACSKKQEPATSAQPGTTPAPAATAPGEPPTQSALTPNTGKVLQVLQAGGYTYAEVNTDDGQKIWIAGAPIQIKPGDSVQWGQFAVMQNFHSKTLNRSFDQILFVSQWGPLGGAVAQVAPHGNNPPPAEAWGAGPAPQPSAAASAADQGTVKSVANAGGYTYLEIARDGGSLWVAGPETAVKSGDKVRWDGGMVMHNFTAKSLGRTFDQIVFASGITVIR